MSKLMNMRGIEIKKFRAVSSGSKTMEGIFGDNGFWPWVEKHRHLLIEHMYEPVSLLWHDFISFNRESQTFNGMENNSDGLNTLIYAIKDDVVEADVGSL